MHGQLRRLGGRTSGMHCSIINMYMFSAVCSVGQYLHSITSPNPCVKSVGWPCMGILPNSSPFSTRVLCSGSVTSRKVESIVVRVG